MAPLIGGAVAADEDPPTLVAVAEARPGDAGEVLELSGEVTSERRARLSARTPGLVGKVHVDAGSRVRQGDVLLVLDDALAKLDHEESRAALDATRARLEELRRLSAEALQLAGTGGIPRTEAVARQAALKIQEATVRQQEVETKRRAEIVSRHTLEAPFPGVISSKTTEAGEWVETGDAVFELVDVDAVRFDVKAPQEWAGRLKEGLPVEIELDAPETGPVAARISALVPVKDSLSRTFLVRISADSPPPTMVPGVSGRARINVPRPEAAVEVPHDAVIREPDGSVVVWVVEQRNGQSVAVRRDVTTGTRPGTRAEILQGIAPGESVVVRGNENLRDQQPVRLAGGGSDT